jgi:hypothetical protein
MSEDAARANYEVVYARGDGFDFGRANENAEGIILRHGPRTASRLGKCTSQPQPATIIYWASPPVRVKPSRSQKGTAAGKLLLGTIAKAPTPSEIIITLLRFLDTRLQSSRVMFAHAIRLRRCCRLIATSPIGNAGDPGNPGVVQMTAPQIEADDISDRVVAFILAKGGDYARLFAGARGGLAARSPAERSRDRAA